MARRRRVNPNDKRHRRLSGNARSAAQFWARASDDAECVMNKTLWHIKGKQVFGTVEVGLFETYTNSPADAVLSDGGRYVRNEWYGRVTWSRWIRRLTPDGVEHGAGKAEGPVETRHVGPFSKYAALIAACCQVVLDAGFDVVDVTR